MSSSSHRRFLASSAVGVFAGTAGDRSLAATPPTARSFPLIGFTKPFADLSFDATADLVAEVG